MPESIAICLPCRGSIRDESFSAILGTVMQAQAFWLGKHGAGASVSVFTMLQTQVAEARDWLAKTVLNGNFDWAFWIDDDALPSKDILEQLYSTGKKWVVPAFYRRLPPYSPCHFFWEPELKDGALRVIDADPDPPRLFPIDCSGFHTMLMHRSVLEAAKSSKPENEPFFLKTPIMGEDLYFCLLAQKGGAQLWADTRIEVGHAGLLNVNHAIYRSYRNSDRGDLAAREAVGKHAVQPLSLEREPYAVVGRAAEGGNADAQVPQPRRALQLGGGESPRRHPVPHQSRKLAHRAGLRGRKA